MAADCRCCICERSGTCSTSERLCWRCVRIGADRNCILLSEWGCAAWKGSACMGATRLEADCPWPVPETARMGADLKRLLSRQGGGISAAAGAMSDPAIIRALSRAVPSDGELADKEGEAPLTALAAIPKSPPGGGGGGCLSIPLPPATPVPSLLASSLLAFTSSTSAASAAAAAAARAPVLLAGWPPPPAGCGALC